MKRILLVLAFVLVFFMAGCEGGNTLDDVEIPEYTVFFNSDDEIYSELVFTVGDMVIPPSNPETEGYEFGGWYIDDSFTNLFGFGAMPNQDINLYARWDAIENVITSAITITFDSLGGTQVNPYFTTSGVQYNPIVFPTRVGHIFAGWYMDPECYYQLPFINDFQNDITLYAKWERDYLTIEFYVDGLKVNERDLLYGEVIYEEYIPNIPEKLGHTIVGWSEEIPERLFQNIVVEAEYSINFYFLAFYSSAENKIVNIIQSDTYRVAISETGVIWGWYEHTPPVLLNDFLDYDDEEYILKGDGEGDYVVLLSDSGRVSLINPTDNVFLGRISSENLFIHDVTDDYTLNAGEAIIDVRLTNDNLIVLTSEGRVLVQGNGGATSGIDATEAVVEVAEIDFSSLLAVDEKIIGIATGEWNVIVYTNELNVFAWGIDTYGIVGDLGDSSTKTSPVESGFMHGDDEQIIKVEIGIDHAAILTTEGLYLIGSSHDSQIGWVFSEYTDYFDVTFEFFNTYGISGIDDVYLGDYFTILHTEFGVYYGIGINTDGQLCNDTFVNVTSYDVIFNELPLRDGEVIEEIFIGDKGGYVISSLGFVYGWGDNDNGQLMFANITDSAAGFQLDSGFPELFMEFGLYYSEFGTIITLPTPPTKEGYEFVGWFNTREWGTEGWELILETEMPANYYILYACYEMIE